MLMRFLAGSGCVRRVLARESSRLLASCAEFKIMRKRLLLCSKPAGWMFAMRFARSAPAEDSPQRRSCHQVSESLARQRLLATVASFCGALAMLLAAIGLYRVILYNVARRRNEIGIRMALGAEQDRVMSTCPRGEPHAWTLWQRFGKNEFRMR